MDREIGRTLAELERKLHDLERALSALAPPGGARLVDENLQGGANVQPPTVSFGESATSQAAPPPSQHAAPPSPLPPSHHATETPPPPPSDHAPSHPAPPTPPLSHHAPPPPPPPPSPAAHSPLSPLPSPASPPPPSDDSIELAELVRFRAELERAMRGLVEDYERIIRLRTASVPSSRSGEA